MHTAKQDACTLGTFILSANCVFPYQWISHGGMQNQCYGGNIYAATKYAQKGLAEVLRWELMPYNIRVHAVCPGFVDTPMSADGTFSTYSNALHPGSKSFT